MSRVRARHRARACACVVSPSRCFASFSLQKNKAGRFKCSAKQYAWKLRYFMWIRICKPQRAWWQLWSSEYNGWKLEVDQKPIFKGQYKNNGFGAKREAWKKMTWTSTPLKIRSDWLLTKLESCWKGIVITSNLIIVLKVIKAWQRNRTNSL